MAVVSPRLLRVRKHLEHVVEEQTNFISSLPILHKIRGTRATPINSVQREKLCEISFAVVFTAWEQFLERSFETYVIDAPLSSFKSGHRVLVADIETARDLIRNDRNYAEWADPAKVRSRAKMFFKNGEPFESALSAVSDDVTKMRIIRNRCVHLSQHAERQYQKMIRNVFGSKKTVSPGGLLLQRAPLGLSSASKAESYSTVFELYGAILGTASSRIVPLKTRR
jgi:hypothetical protein